VATCVGMKGSADKVARLGWIGGTRKHAVCSHSSLHIRRDWQHEVDSAHAPSRMQRRPCLVLHHTTRALHAPRPRLPCLLGLWGGLGM